MCSSWISQALPVEQLTDELPSAAPAGGDGITAAKAVNTSLSTGAVLPGQSPSNENYYRFTDQLAQSPTGQWQVVSNYPVVYYPQAKECKP